MIHIAELQAKANLIIGERISGKKKRRSDIPVDSDVSVSGDCAEVCCDGVKQ